MKHTLQSLLITTVLALPTAFGALQIADSSAPTTTHSSTVGIFNSSKPSLAGLIQDVLEDISGLVYISEDGIKFDCGWLDPDALSRLALTCSWLNQLVQPVLNSIKVLRENNSIPRLLQSHLTSQDRALQLVGVSKRSFNESGAVPFNELLNAAFAVRFWTIPMTATEHTALVDLIKEHPTLTSDQKDILRGILPNATPDDIRWAGFKLQKLGLTERATAFFERSGDHPTATPIHIEVVGDLLQKLGLTDKAIAFF